jgi:hypothetical protein
MPNSLNSGKPERSVIVFNGNMTQLKPLTPAKARILIEQKKAKVYCTSPFCIRLNYVKKIGSENKSKE